MVFPNPATPAERLASALWRLRGAVHLRWYHGVVAHLAMLLIGRKIAAALEALSHLAAQIEAGTYQPTPITPWTAPAGAEPTQTEARSRAAPEATRDHEHPPATPNRPAAPAPVQVAPAETPHPRQPAGGTPEGGPAPTRHPPPRSRPAARPARPAARKNPPRPQGRRGSRKAGDAAGSVPPGGTRPRAPPGQNQPWPSRRLGTS